MNIKDIEVAIIGCFKKNIEMSEAPVPNLTRKSAPLKDIENFDSLRMIEVMVDLELKFGCEIELEDIFGIPDPQEIQICVMAEIIRKKIEDQNK